jgi:DNA-binding transcriptional LysR family regulator
MFMPRSIKMLRHYVNAMAKMIVIVFQHIHGCPSCCRHCMSDPDDALPDPRLLRLFECLFRTRSVTATAVQLGQSQPTVSLALGRLRRQLGDPLFVRTPAGMQPTPRAEALMGPVQDALSALEALQRMAVVDVPFDPATAQRRFRICMTDASHVTLLPRLLAHVRALGPDIRLVAARIDDTTGPALQAGEADLALGLVPWLDAGFYQQALFPQDWICLSKAQHPRLGGGLTRAAYEREDHVGITSGTGAQLLEQALVDHRVVRRVMLELPGFLGLAAIVSQTDLIATLPRHIGETLARSAGLAVHACPFAIAGYQVKQYWHARQHHDAAHRWLRGVCGTLFQHETPPA